MNIAVALALGACAGLIDIVPMMRSKVYLYSIISVFIQWLLISLAIVYLNWDLPWLKGLIVGVLGMQPVAVQVIGRNKAAVIPTLAYGALLGAALGWLSSILTF